MGNALTPIEKLSEEEERRVLGYDCSVQQIAEYIRSGRAKNIVLMVGAGISVSAGIPDFRTPGSGLYDNLQKYNLSAPEEMFSIQYFHENPAPFYDLARSLLPSNFNPTPTHYFIKLLEKKGLLKRCYSQNIDTLERRAEVSPDLLVEAHGSFGVAHCVKCNTEYSDKFFKNKIIDKTDGITDSSGEEIPWCKCDAVGCDGNVKPDIVFFGEGLPSRYFDLREIDMDGADLLIVAGTSLKVAPFSHTMHFCNARAPRLLINRERVGTDEFKFDTSRNYRDVELLGDCDEGILLLCELVGWREELESLILEHVPDWAAPPANLALTAVEKITKNYRSDSSLNDSNDADIDTGAMGSILSMLPPEIALQLQSNPALLRSFLGQAVGSDMLANDSDDDVNGDNKGHFAPTPIHMPSAAVEATENAFSAPESTVFTGADADQDNILELGDDGTFTTH